MTSTWSADLTLNLLNDGDHNVPLDLAELQTALPKLTQTLTDMMVKDGLGGMIELGLTIEAVEPSVSVTLDDTVSGGCFKLVLSIEAVKDDET
jgi:hypothetical protein